MSGAQTKTSARNLRARSFNFVKFWWRKRVAEIAEKWRFSVALTIYTELDGRMIPQKFDEEFEAKAS